VAKSHVIIPADKNHKCLTPYGIGNKLKTKINVNLGTSKDCLDMEIELSKVKAAVDMGAELIMDLSSFGDAQAFRKKLTSECPAIIGTVPIYDAVVYYNKDLETITAREWIDIVKMHAGDGVYFMTIHCGINKTTISQIEELVVLGEMQGGTILCVRSISNGCHARLLSYNRCNSRCQRLVLQNE